MVIVMSSTTQQQQQQALDNATTVLRDVADAIYVAGTPDSENPKPCMEYTDTELQIHKMLCGRGPRGMCDSGGAYGYANESWRRASRHYEGDLRRLPYCTVTSYCTDTPYVPGKSYLEMGAQISAFHHLCENLHYERAMSIKYMCHERDDLGWEEILDLYLDFHNRHSPEEMHLERCGEYNTANGDDCLDNAYLYYGFEGQCSDQQYVLLQVHNGCDLRAGYGVPSIFSVVSESFYNNDDYYAGCDCATVTGGAGDADTYNSRETWDEIDGPPATWQPKNLDDPFWSQIWCTKCKQLVQ